MKPNIKGWGADLDPKNRPGVPREKSPPGGTGAHWDEPEKQVPKIKVFVSPEHKGLTATFGTSCPPKGMSGLIRSYAYTLSEGKKMHWMLLLLADRVDVYESLVSDFLKLSPPNLIKETGIASEFRSGGFFSRFGNHRADIRRQALKLGVGLAIGAFVVKRLQRTEGYSSFKNSSSFAFGRRPFSSSQAAL